jgi:hypothetical protein
MSNDLLASAARLEHPIEATKTRKEAPMSHDFESREWAENHHLLSEGIGRFVATVMHAFKRLNAIEYDAPWNRKVEDCSCTVI